MFTSVEHVSLAGFKRSIVFTVQTYRSITSYAYRASTHPFGTTNGSQECDRLIRGVFNTIFVTTNLNVFRNLEIIRNLKELETIVLLFL